MARPLRISFPGAFHHVISRGNARQMVFTEPWDHSIFIDTLGVTCERFGWHCHAYCVMGNHYHLLIEVRDPNLPEGMRHLNGVFAQAYNRHRRRVGHLFQGRYKALLVQDEKYLLELARYIVLNPVRGRLVPRPEKWPWSSYAWLAGLRVAPVWAHPGTVWRALHEDPAEARRRFVALVAEGPQERVPGWSRDGILGSEEYKSRLKLLLERQRQSGEIGVGARFADRPSLEQLLAGFGARRNCAARNAAIGEAVMRWRYSQAAVARTLGLHAVTVSCIVKRMRTLNLKT